MIKTAVDNIYSGCNVESPAYPEGTCGVVGAISAMIRAGERDIPGVAVIGCMHAVWGLRQKLAEFAGPDMLIQVCFPNGLLLETTLGGTDAFCLRSVQRGRSVR